MREQSLGLQDQLKTAHEKIANMEKETKLLYSSTSEFVRRINEQELKLAKAATRLQMDTEAAESRAAIAEQKLERSERLGERALAESRSALTLTTAAPTSSYATLPSAGSAANLLRAPRPTSALTGRELPAKDAVGARSTVRVGELVRPQSAKR